MSDNVNNDVYKRVKEDLGGRLTLEMSPGLAFWEADGGIVIDTPLELPAILVEDIPVLVEFLLTAYKRQSTTLDAVIQINSKKHQENLLKVAHNN